jgi:hypothetical protein
MRISPWLTLATLALTSALTVPARAQWTPGGTLVASNVADIFGFGVVAVPDGQAGGLVLALESGPTGFGHQVERIGPDGRFPAGWPSTAVQGSYFSAGLAADGAGGAYLGRTKEGPAGSQIVVRHLLADGSLDPTWPVDGRIVADLPGSQGIQLASDGGGGVYAVFGATTNAGGQLGVLRLDNTGAASPGWPAAGVTIAQTSADYLFFGDVQATDTGVYVMGSRSSTLPETDSYDVFIGHLSPAGTIPTGWGAGTVAVPFLLAGSYPPPYTPDTSGGIYYTWSNGTVGRLVHLLADASLDPAWPVRGLGLLADTTHYQFLRKPVSDGAGGCFARFDYDSAGTSTNLVPRLVHLTADATPEPGWPLLGGRLPYIFNGFVYGDIVPDGSGGAYATWLEEVAPTVAFGFRYLRAHHIAAGGGTAPDWPVAGLTLASGPGARIATRMVTDTHGGAIAFWVGTRTDTATELDSSFVLALGFGPDGTLTTSVGDRHAAFPGGLRASPVPARGPTSLVFALARTSNVKLDVLDLSGRRIRHLFDGTFAPGPHSLTWDGRDDAGRTVPPGVYLAHADGEGVVSSARLVRIR